MSESITMVSAILATSTTPSPDGTVYTEAALKSLADAYPAKLEYRDGVLYSRTIVDDPEHRVRWDRTLLYHVGEMARKASRSEFDTVVLPKMMANVVEPTDTGFKLYLVHPQWGGYGVPATVEFDRRSGDLKGGPGRFELSCYHDGEFPTTSVELERHCCSAEQFIRFGLDVLEAQMAHQQDADGQPVALGQHSQLESFAERIQKLLGR